jgi:anhydro-N-acetylmuramic acid kinase
MKRVIGLMSGTSLDGIDAALIETDGVSVARFGAGETVAYSAADRAVLQAAVDTALAWRFEGDMPDFREAEQVLTGRHAELVVKVLAAEGLAADAIDLIGFHGQTVLHRAPAGGRPGRTLQIGDGAALARATGIPVVCDFRSEDVERGGQGAPLATLYHAALADWSDLPLPAAVLNLGGVANVTWLASGTEPVAFDTGPANGLIDAWCQRLTGEPFDRDGALALSGTIDEAAFGRLMAHPFFRLPPPKSLDRWDFSLEPVEGLCAADGAATLTAFTAQTVADAIAQLGRPDRLLVTGGGRHNPALMAMLEDRIGVQPEPVEAVGWRGDLLEAEAFAWLAVRVERGLPTSLPSTTGVSEPVSGGRLVLPDA